MAFSTLRPAVFMQRHKTSYIVRKTNEHVLNTCDGVGNATYTLPENDAPSQYPMYTIDQPQKLGLTVQSSDRRPEYVTLGGQYFEDPNLPLLLSTQSSSS